MPDIFVSLVGHFPYIEPSRTKCLAMLEPSAGHQQKSAGHVRHISRGLSYSDLLPLKEGVAFEGYRFMLYVYIYYMYYFKALVYK